MTPGYHILFIESHSQSFWMLNQFPKIGDPLVIEDCTYQYTAAFDESDTSTKIILKQISRRDQATEDDSTQDLKPSS